MPISDTKRNIRVEILHFEMCIVLTSGMAWMIAPSQWTLSQHSADAGETIGWSVKGSSWIFSGFETNCAYSESSETLVMLCYAMCVTVNIIFIHFNIWHEIHRQTCLAPEGTRKSISGPRPKKVVHHCCKLLLTPILLGSSYYTGFASLTDAWQLYSVEIWALWTFSETFTGHT